MAASQLALAYLDIRARDKQLKSDLSGIKGAVLGSLGAIAGPAKAIMQGMVGAIGGVLGTLKGVFSSVLGSLRRMFEVAAGMLIASGLKASFQGMVDFFKDAETLGRVQVQAEKRLEAVLRATGNACGYTVGELKKMAAGLQEVTNFGDETTLAGMAILATFKGIKGDMFKRTVEAAQDMASVMQGTDLKAGMIQLGKAIEDPIKGMTALRRSGVSFTDAQREQIKLLQEAGDLLGAQEIVMRAVEGQFKGTARAMADPVLQARNAIGDVKEEFGKIIMQFKEAAASRFMGWLSSDAGRQTIDVLKTGFADILAYVGRIGEGARQMVGAFRESLDTEQGQRFVATLRESWELLKEIGANLQDTFGGIFRSMSDWGDQAHGKWSAWFQVTADWFRNLTDWLSVLTADWRTTWKLAVTTSEWALSRMVDFAKQSWGQLKAIVIQSSTEWGTFVVGHIQRIIDALRLMADTAIAAFKGVWAALQAGFSRESMKDAFIKTFVDSLHDIEVETPEAIARRARDAGEGAARDTARGGWMGTSRKTRELWEEMSRLTADARKNREWIRRERLAVVPAEEVPIKDDKRKKPRPGEAAAAEAAAKTTGKTAMVGFAELSAKMQQSMEGKKEAGVQKDIAKEAKLGRIAQQKSELHLDLVVKELKKPRVAKVG